MTESLRSKLTQIPGRPGVYFHKNARGEVLYIGKAAILKNRVRQYFQKSRGRDPKTDALVAEIADIEWIEVETELDALLVEAEMVRRYLPPYNILLRDDKSMQYVRIDYDSDYPTVTTIRRPLDDGARYFGPYLQGAKSVVIEDPYIRLQHQIQNFVRFCETVLKAGTVKKISLITGYDDKTQLADIAEKLDELKQSLLELDVELEVKLNPNMHDREIRIDNGWASKIGRGLDFFQKPGGWFEVGANDLSLRKCLETKVDIFRA